MKYYGRLLSLIFTCALVAGVVAYGGATKNIVISTAASGQVAYHSATTLAYGPHEGYQAPKPALILYSPQDEVSAKLAKSTAEVFAYQKRAYRMLNVIHTEAVSYDDYSLVLVATPNLEEELPDDARRLTRYARQGGKLLWAILPNSINRQFLSIYRELGIAEYGDYVDYVNLRFQRDLLLGAAGRLLADEGLSDVGLFVRLKPDAQLYVTADVRQQQLPVFWTVACGEGRVGVWNGFSLGADFYRGAIAGCVNAVEGNAIYPVINARCIFIDDFPSPQYESESDVVRAVYNRSAKEFYRDIWWPDMQQAARRYGYKYTGLFIATYNDIVQPDEFVFSEPSMLQYYGNSLLRAGHEMGLHGYNHQSLAEEGMVPEEMCYNAWDNTEDMAASILELRQIARQLFPGAVYMTYVPPSNYLSAMGRNAVACAMPDLKIISGVYTSEGKEGAVYVQRYEVAKDGVVEFPRVTSGMIPNGYEELAWRSALTLHGVFSHFIHPDDIFDEERGYGKSWEELIDGFHHLLADVNHCSCGMRSLIARGAANALKVYQELTPYITVTDTRIDGTLDNFHGEAYFFLRTEATPRSVDDGCTIGSLNQDGKGCYYLVHVRKPSFSILLEEGKP